MRDRLGIYAATCDISTSGPNADVVRNFIRAKPPVQCTPPNPTSKNMDLHLQGKRVLITGASKGIGAAAAEAFAEEGCHLRLAARNTDALQALATKLRAAHGIEVS